MTTLRDIIRDLALNISESEEKLTRDEIELLVDEAIDTIKIRLIEGTITYAR